MTNTLLIKNEGGMDQCVQSSSSSLCQMKNEAELQAEQQRGGGGGGGGLPQLQQISHNLATDLGLYNVSGRSSAQAIQTDLDK